MGTIIGVVMSCHMLGVAAGAYLMFLIQGLLEFLAVIFALLIKQKGDFYLRQLQ